MNIVVFGCDNSGKTTLCSQLVKLFNEDADFTAEAVHSLGPNKSFEEMMSFMEKNLVPVGSTHTKIFDRFPLIEESIYGPLLRGENKFEGVNVREIWDKVDLFIYCYPGLFTILNWGEREQMDGVKANVLELINQYNRMAVLLKANGYDVREYNFKCDDFRKVVQ